MRKYQSLKDHMTKALTHRGVAANPADLYFHIPQGSLQATQRDGLAFNYAYTLTFAVLDSAWSVDEIMIPLLMWVQRWQPDLLALTAPEGGIAFEIEDQDEGSKVDVLVRVPLTEAVCLTRREGGGYDVTRPEEPLPFALQDGEPLHAVYLRDELIGHCADHPELG